MIVSESLARWRTRFVPDHVVGEVLSKNWIDNAIPVAFLVLAVCVFGSIIPNFFLFGNLTDEAREFGEIAIVVLGMTIVLMGGGIDLSVGSTFALANFVTLALINWQGWPAGLAIACALSVGALVGLLNGFLVGYMRLRAFLTTLVTLIVVRAIADTLVLNYSNKVVVPAGRSPVWEYLSYEDVYGVPVAFIVAGFLAVVGHVFLTRLRPGWRILAVGGSRRAAYNAGLPVRRIVAGTYVLSGVLAALGGVFYASRLGAATATTGAGLEVAALTAAVLGGVSLGGGRGSVTKALLGAAIVLIIGNSLIQMGLRSGTNTLVLGVVLMLAVAIDVKWLKNRFKLLSRVYVSPAYFKLPPRPSTEEGSTSPYALNDRLGEVDLIGLGQIEAAEDPILDIDDNLFFGSRQGDIIRYFGPDHTRWEVYAHVGGMPLGLAFDKAGDLVCCVAGMGLYKIVRDTREVVKLTDETNRSWLSVIDDSRLRLPDDLDIAPDGRIFFSEATARFDMHEWMVDALEARGNGRIICYDPRDRSTRTIIPNIRFANGVCLAHDARSLFFASTWSCTVERYWLDGPKKGTTETVIGDLPGYPDNINRASDGTYWLALAGMRTPAFDLALRKPGFRRRMVQQLAQDEWLFPQMNVGCVVKFDDSGVVLETLWDREGVNHPMITSCNEHRGHLYLGGIVNNRVGRVRLTGADDSFTSQGSYWGLGR